jgi:hypothetical protein
MTRVVYDIETVGVEFQKLDTVQQEYFLQWASSDKDKERMKSQTAFYALTGKVIAVAMLNPDTGRGRVYGVGSEESYEDDDIEFLFVPDEKTLLWHFWEDAANYQQFVTFNGRTFDAPYLLLRSAVNRLKPSCDIMGYRYRAVPHLDLADQMSFFGATRRHFPLHFYCKAFGIESPKEEGMSGLDVSPYFAHGRIR